MSVRFCPSCEAEVEVSQGSCLLGHPVSLQPMTSSLSELRAEVDKAFADAELQVATVLAGTPATEAAATVPGMAESPATPFESDHRVHRMPPPPPPLTTTAQMAVGLARDHSSGSGSDPISEFAPPPRMDWGPDKGKRSLLRRRTG